MIMQSMTLFNKKYRVAFLMSHPIHYHIPLFKKMSQDGRIEPIVYFCSNFGVKEETDPLLGVKVKWDIPLLDGYKYKFLRNFSIRPSFKFWGQINPGIFLDLLKGRYDALVIYGYSYATNWIAIFGAWITGTPLILGGEMVLRPDRPLWKRAIKRAAMKFIFWRSRAFISIGSFSDKFYEYYGASDDKIFSTPYAVDNERFMEAKRKIDPLRDGLRGNFKIGKNDAIIIFMGKLVPGKRPLDLLKAYEILRIDYKISNIGLIFVGDGVLRPELEKYTEENNILNVHFAGFKNQSELPNYYAISDIFVSPSVSDVSPLVVNEAMCFSLPVIISNAVYSAYDYVKHGENGFIFGVGDTRRLSENLLELINDEKKRKKFGDKSLEIIKLHSYENQINGILSAVKKCKS